MKEGAEDRLVLHPDGLTVTHLGPGLEVHAVPHDTDEYRDRAKALGYGDDTLAMSREHEVLHTLLAHMLGLPHSPTLMGVATRHHWKHWRTEEAAVLAVQAYARAAGVDVVALVA